MKAICTKYFGPSNVRGSRIKADDGDGNSITISRDCALSVEEAHDQAARALCVKMGWNGMLMRGQYGHTRVYTFIDDMNVLAINPVEQPAAA